MGYTHYYTQKRAFTDEEWAQLCQRATAICIEAGDKVRTFRINGIDEWSGLLCIRVDGSCEPLIIRKEMYYRRGRSRDEPVLGWCKTEHGAYDETIRRIMAAARSIAPDAIELSTDDNRGLSVFEFE